MSTRLVVCVISILSLVSVVGAGQPKHMVVVTDATGQDRARSQPETAKPTGAAASLPEIMVFFLKHDVRDAKGRVVSGLGFITWMEGAGVHVAVFTMVPKPGAPNTFLAGNPEQTASLQPVALVDFGLKVGESRSLNELKALGVDPMVVSFKSVVSDTPLSSAYAPSPEASHHADEKSAGFAHDSHKRLKTAPWQGRFRTHKITVSY